MFSENNEDEDKTMMMIKITGVVSWLGPTTMGSSSITTCPLVFNVPKVPCSTNRLLVTEENKCYPTRYKDIKDTETKTNTNSKTNVYEKVHQDKDQHQCHQKCTCVWEGSPRRHQCHGKPPNSSPLPQCGAPWLGICLSLNIIAELICTGNGKIANSVSE